MNRLNIRAIRGILLLAVVMAALLFVSAGTLDYWQAWVLLAAFFVPAIAITLYLMKKDRALLERRMSAGPLAEKEGAQKIIMLLASIGFIALIVVSAVDHRMQWSNVSFLVTLLGDVLVVLGFLVEFVVFRENTFSSATIEIAKDQRVISTGPYAIVRHPMYVGGLIMLFGIPLALGSYWGLLVLAAMTPVLVWRLLDEERLLSENLSGYAEYRAKVRSRLVPGVF